MAQITRYMYLGNRCTRPIIALPLSPLDDNFPRFPAVSPEEEREEEET